jgi:ribosome recycling factor
MTASVEKAIRESDLGLNPMTEGNLIRVPIPDLSEDRRKEMVKVAGRYAEAARVAVRNVRRDGIEAIRSAEKEGLLSEDERHSEEGEVQKLTDQYVKLIDESLANKEKEITHV